MAKKTVKTKTKDRLQTEAELLNAAEKIFSKFGFKGATTRLIAKEANFNPALINRYFNGKYGLLIALIENKSKRAHNPDYPDQETLQEEIKSYAEFFFDNMTEDINLFKIVIGQFMVDAKFLKRFRNLINTVCENTQIEYRLERFIKSGQLRDKTHIEEIVNSVENMAFGTVISEIIVRDRPRLEARNEFSKFLHDYVQIFKP